MAAVDGSARPNRLKKTMQQVGYRGRSAGNATCCRVTVKGGRGEFSLVHCCFWWVSILRGALKAANLQQCMGTAEGRPMFLRVGFRQGVVRAIRAEGGQGRVAMGCGI